MLEGLDSIDWGKITHVYPSAQLKVPKYIRDLLSDDVDIRKRACSALYGFGAQEYAMLFESALYIAPFFIELLEYEHTPDKATILKMLADWGHLTSTKPYIRDEIRYMEILEQAETTFIQLMQHPNSVMRERAIGVIGRYELNRSNVLAAMRQHFDDESDELIKIQLINTTALFLESERWKNYEFALQCSNWFDILINASESHNIRVAAARARIKCFRLVAPDWYRRQNELDHTIPYLVDAFFEEWEKLYHQGFHNVKPIFQDLALIGNNALLRLLQDKRLTAHSAHHIVKYILESEFATESLSSEDYPYTTGDSYETPAEIQYLKVFHPFGGPVNNLGSERLKILQIIIDCDPFWQIPTNLFSFFYGLPDNRDELRKLVAPE